MGFPSALWMMAAEELRESLALVRALDAALLVQLFGVEGARRYRRHLRKENDAFDREGASAAYDARAAMEMSLSDREQRLLFGIGSDGVIDEEDVREYLRAASDFDVDSAAGLGKSLRMGLLRLGEGPREFGEMKFSELIAYSQVRAGFLYARVRGWDSRIVLAAVFDAVRGLYADPDDGEYMCAWLAREVGRDEGASLVAWLTMPPLLADSYRAASPSSVARFDAD